MVFEICLVLFLLLTKHLIADFIIQGPYQYLNKGNAMHPGGYLHAGIHAVGTMIILYMVVAISWQMVLLLGLFDLVIHYITDFTKVNVCKRKNWTATNSPYFWWATGIDQYIHLLTYLIIVVFINL